MNDQQLLRYSRQIMLPELDITGQQALLGARVLIVGLGGLGSPAALYLAAAGIGHLVLADHDRVDVSNLSRQLLHGAADVGDMKTESACRRLRQLNPELHIDVVDDRCDANNLPSLTENCQLVIDATDNLPVRYHLNRACISAQVPLVSAAATGFEAQLTSFDFRKPQSPCYACLWPQATQPAQNCADNGIIAPLTGIMGALQAMEAIKLISGVGRPLLGRVLTCNALGGVFTEFRYQRRSDCAACQARPR